MSIYRIFLLCFAACATLPMSSGLLLADKALEDWTLTDVLEAIETANGGKEAIEATTNIRIRGKIDNQEIEYEFVLLKKRPDKMRIKLMFKGRSTETGFNGIGGWTRVTQNGQRQVSELTAEEIATSSLDVDFDGPLIGELFPGFERRLIGVERFGRVDYFVVEVSKSNVRTRHYIDSRSFKEWKTVREIKQEDGTLKTVESEFFEYERRGTIWLANRVERRFDDGRRETIIIESADIDPGLLDQAFDVPRDWSEN